jgi:hypothetical protein
MEGSDLNNLCSFPKGINRVFAGFQVFMVANSEINVFCNVTPCNFVKDINFSK